MKEKREARCEPKSCPKPQPETGEVHPKCENTGHVDTEHWLQGEGYITHAGLREASLPRKRFGQEG